MATDPASINPTAGHNHPGRGVGRPLADQSDRDGQCRDPDYTLDLDLGPVRDRDPESLCPGRGHGRGRGPCLDPAPAPTSCPGIGFDVERILDHPGRDLDHDSALLPSLRDHGLG